MLKWFEQTEKENPNIVYSRIRLARNLDSYEFPGKLTEKEGAALVCKLKEGMRDIPQAIDDGYEFLELNQLSSLEKTALRERRLINEALEKKTEPAGLILSEDESSSIILNGDDHIRIQLLGSGLCLGGLWEKADKMDDFINARFSYAYHEKYGYLTSYPTNVGTGMRASVLIHLPTLSMGKKFTNLLGEMSRFGTRIRGIYGEGSENAGSLYVISNQKTLGVSEQEIVDLVGKVAVQLNSQESKVREMALSSHRLERTDEAYKSYGVLKYARRLAWKDAMVFLSHVMTGVSDGLLTLKEPCSIYSIMLGIQRANLQDGADRPLGREELDVARASYIRNRLPELK
ncbi:ATP--guanido phosphotransferase [Lachnoclostridium edouardi]|uniref:ATP--guanido phosphotransferase n=1 Tax=Lachnoclostridium edouardi TaxID=1926283 RepID=UPI000C79CF90|nr:ATP--guanido phosphotransferase [Lachnoclostridium edouardi]